MLNPRGLFPAIMAACLTGVILGHQLWLLVVLGYLIYRIYTLQDPVTTKFTLGIAVVVSGLCFYTLRQSQIKPLKAPVNTDCVLKVMPDQVKVNGNLVTITGTNLQTNEHLMATVKLKTASEKVALEHNDHVLWWHVKGQAQPIIGPTNVNQFDYQKYQWRQHIFNEIKVTQETWQPVADQGIVEHCHQWRQKMHLYFQTLPAPTREYCDSLIIGYATVASNELLTSVKRLGVIHLFCISGMHVVLLIALLRGLLIRLHLEIELIDWGLIITLPLYLIIGGGAASLIRALILAEVHLISKRLHWSFLDAWSISLMIGILIDPYVLLTLGGQLSYLMSLLMPLSLSHADELKRAFWLNLASLPSLLHYVYEVHLLSTLVSWLLIPLFGTIIFPLTIIVALCGRWLPLLLNGFNQMLATLQNILDCLAQIPLMLHFGKTNALVSVILLILTLWLMANPQQKRSWQLLIVTYGLAFSWLHIPLHGEVNFVDIGQGDCAIITTPIHRQVVMIDTGGRLNFQMPAWAKYQTNTDQASKTSLNYLKSQGISKIDAVCLSHSDADHIGYLPTVLKTMTVKAIYVPVGMQNNPKFKHLVKQPVKIVPVQAGTTIPVANLQVLHPFVPGPGSNEDSMVLWGEFGGLKFLFTGDLNRAEEVKLVTQNPNLHADVLKLSHHGSKTGSDPVFLAKLQPKYGIISAGRFNRYGHPNNETMQNLKQAQITPISTQQYGMITYDYYGTHGNWKTKLKGDELTWMLPPYPNS